MAEGPPQGKAGRLEDPEALRQRRDTVLERYQGFKEAARQRREKLEGARKFQQFRRDADELESWIREKMQVVSDDAYKDSTNLQVCKKGGGAGIGAAPAREAANLCNFLSLQFKVNARTSTPL